MRQVFVEVLASDPASFSHALYKHEGAYISFESLLQCCAYDRQERGWSLCLCIASDRVGVGVSVRLVSVPAGWAATVYNGPAGDFASLNIMQPLQCQML